MLKIDKFSAGCVRIMKNDAIFRVPSHDAVLYGASYCELRS